MIVLEVLPQDAPEVVPAKRDDVIEALVSDRSHEALGVRVQVGTERGQTDGLDALAGEQPSEGGRGG